MSESRPRRRRREQIKPVHTLAIAYQRVSTKKQSEKEKSSIARQNAALESFKRAHPEIPVRVTPIREAISGNRKNVQVGLLGRFLREAQEGKVNPGTVLVCESTDRLTRAGINDGLALLSDLFRAEVAVCFTDFENEIHSTLSHNVYRIAGSLDGAGKLSQDRQRNSEGAVDRKYELIAELANGKRARFGKNYFRPRGPDNTAPGYPIWLDVTEDSEYGEWMIEDQWADHVRKAFRMAAQPANGIVTITRALQADGARSTTDPKKPINQKTVQRWLNHRGVLGEYVPTSKDYDGTPILNVFPPIITPKQWEATQAGIRSRGGRGADPKADGTRPPAARRTINRDHRNLFQGHTYCGRCGSVMGATSRQPGRKPRLQCSGRVRNLNGCDAPNVLYEEERWLNSLASFRWREMFGSQQHQGELRDLQTQLLRATAEVNACAAETEKALNKCKEADPSTSVTVLNIWAADLEAKEGDQREAEYRLRVLQGELATKEQRKSGREVEAEVKARIADFIASDRSDPIKRAEFHAWLSEQDLVLVLNNGACEIGLGKFEGPLLVELDGRLDDLTVLGGDVRPGETLEEALDSLNPNTPATKRKPRHRGRRAKRRTAKP